MSLMETKRLANVTVRPQLLGDIIFQLLEDDSQLAVAKKGQVSERNQMTEKQITTNHMCISFKVYSLL
jgi:hypothetical protein